MTDIPAAVPPPAPPAGPKPNPFQRIVGVLFAPNETFASIARQPDWVLPLVLLLVCSIAGGIVMAQRVDFGAAVREQMESRKDIPPDAVDRAVRMTTAVSKVFAYAAPVFATILYLIIAGVLLLAFRLFGGEGDFKQAFSATVYAWIPGLIKSVIIIIVVLARGTVPAQDLAVMVRSNPGFLVDMKAHPMAFAALTSLDLFTVWMVILLIIGFACLSKLSKAKSAVIVICLWALTVVFKLIPAAIQTLRG
jgi:hypothetical protein